MTRKPIHDNVKRLRQRRRRDGSWRLWWEPESNVKALGFDIVDLDEDRPTWSKRQAEIFNADVAKAMTGQTSTRRSTGGRTIEALINEYRHSRSYKKLAPTTIRAMNTNLATITRKWGTHMVVEFSKPVMFNWYETMFDTSGPAGAKSLILTMSGLFSYSELLGWRAENSNPCFRLGMQSTRKRKRSATWAEFDQLIASADALGMPEMACAIALTTLQAQRQGDVIAARIDGFREITVATEDGEQENRFVWELIRSKRMNFGVMPLHPEVEPRVRAILAAAKPNQQRLIIDHATKRPPTGDLFRKRWAQIRTEAAKLAPSLVTPGNVLQYRDLRRTFAVWARAGGGSAEDIGDILGNSAGTDPGLRETYMPPSFHTVARAMDAIKRPQKQKRKKA